MTIFDAKGKVHVSLESLLWFTALTAVGTVVGAYVYQRWVLPYMPDASDLTAFNFSSPSSPPAGTPGPQMGNVTPIRRRRR